MKCDYCRHSLYHSKGCGWRNGDPCCRNCGAPMDPKWLETQSRPLFMVRPTTPSPSKAAYR